MGVVNLALHNLRQASAGDLNGGDAISEIHLVYANNAAKSRAEMIRVALR
jgi:hypothetical protein